MATGLAGAGFVLVLALVAWAVASAVATRVMLAETERHLVAATTLGAERLRASQEESLDSITGALARSSGYRVSVFDAEQRLIADSDFGAQQAGAAPHPAERAEVVGALRRVAASSRRLSALDGRPYVFSAARLYRSGRPVVIRFAAPVAPIADAAGQVARGVLLAVLLAGAAGVFVLYRGTDAVSGKLDGVRHLLTRIAAGETAGPRVKLSRFIELARVGSAANRVRGELEEQLGGVTRERDELAQLMDEVGEGLMALTNDARILRINPAARGLLGLVEVLPFSPVGSLVRDPVLRDFLEASVVRAEGRLEVTVGDRELEVRTKRGTAGGAVVLLVDITEIRRLEAVRTDFVANASHELKTPLTVIRAAAETVLDAELPADLRSRFLRSIEGNTVRLQRLVDDLLDLSRYESGAWRPERERLFVQEVAWEVWKELEESWSERDLEFRIVGEGEALGDEGAAYQIFRNLFENALRYVPGASGRITVEITRLEDMIQVAVEDNGSGIPPSSLPRIFERFYRVDTARSRDEGGTGLGLAIVRHLVSSMGGDVGARSSLGAGTTITFAIPAAESFNRSAVVRAGLKVMAACAIVAQAACVAGDGGDGVVTVGGSSSLYALSEAVAESFAGIRPGFRVTVGFSGTAGGLRQLCDGEIDIAGASRRISTAEAARCRAMGFPFLEIPVARDGIAIVVNPANTGVDCLTLEELTRLWGPAGEVRTWRDLRPAFPDETIRLFGPGPDSGTFRYFTSVVVGRPGASRADHYQSEDDGLIARGVAGDRRGLGYFGSAAYASHRETLRAVPVDTGFGCVDPTREAVADGRYSPLSRDLFIYVGVTSLAREVVYAFADHYLFAAAMLTAETGYVPLPPAEYVRGRAVLRSGQGAP